MTLGSTPASPSTSPTASRSYSETEERPEPEDVAPRPGRPLLPLVLPAVAGAVAMLVVTRRGAYLSPDALSYVGTARGLVDGNGYSAPPGSPPLGNFPPLYPLVLAAVGYLGADPLTVARFLNPLLLGVTVLVVGFLLHRITGSLPLAVAGQLLLVSGVDLLAYHSSALSEPLFLLLAILALAAVGAYLRSPRPGLLVAAALLAAAACLTRYLGVTVVAAGALALGAYAPRAPWRTAGAYAALALAPLAGWLAWVNSVEGRATNREAVYHAPDVDYVVDGLRSASTWVLPADVPWGVRLVAAAGVVAALVWLVRRRPQPGRPLPALVALFPIVYLVALVVDRTWFDVTGRLDARFLLPLHVAAVVAALWALSRLDLDRTPAARLALSTVVGLQVAAGAIWVYDAATDASVRPGGFTAPTWERSAILGQVRALAPGATVFTNQVDALYFQTGRVASPLPEKAAFLTGEPNPIYSAELLAMVDALGSDGLVVYFTAAPSRRVFLPSPDELARLQLELVHQDEVALAYRRPSGIP